MIVTIETVEEYEKLIAKVVTNNTARLSPEQEPLVVELILSAFRQGVNFGIYGIAEVEV